MGYGQQSSNYGSVAGLLPNTYEILSNILLPSFTPRAEKLLAIIIADFDVTVKLLIIYSTYVKCLGKKIGVKGDSAPLIY